MPEDSELVEEILADWRERRDRGDHQDPEDVIRAHPDLEEGLRARFRALDVLELTLAYGPDAARTLPRRIGEYRILRELGRGGMGDVYEAEQVSMQRRVALKVLHPRITNSSHAVKRFQREARAAGRLHHTNIVPVFGMGCEAGSWFYAMELVEGATLERILERMRRLKGEAWAERVRLLSTTEGGGAASSPSAPEGGASVATSGRREYYGRIAEMFAGVAEALQLAHEQGVIHRDIKPSNLILDPAGWLKITDFGLARVEGETAALTVSGSRIGTPLYMSPEQAMARTVPVDHRTDIYSLGATLYETLTLRPPYEGADLPDLCRQILTTDPTPPSRLDRHIPRDLETIALKAMEKERERRYGSAVEMARDLRAFARGDAISARPVGPAGRLWRKVRRHRALSILVAAVVLLASVATLLGIQATREAKSRRGREYAGLCARAEQSLVAGDLSGEDCSFGAESTRSARRLLDEAIALLPELPWGYLDRALAPGATTGERLEDIERASKRGLGGRAAHLARALVLRGSGSDRMRDAKEEEGIALSLPESGLPEEAYLEGQLLVRMGRRREGIVRLTKAVQGSAPGGLARTLARYARAFAEEQEGDFAGAIDDLASLRGAGGELGVGPRVRKASLWRRLGHPDKAEAEFTEILDEARKQQSPDAWDALCGAVATAQELAWLERASEEGQRSFPDSPRLDFFRSNSLASSKHFDESLPPIRRAVDREPGNAHFWTHLGARCEDLGKHKEALEALDEALSIDERFVEALDLRARIFEGMGKRSEAVAAYRLAVSRVGDSAELWSNMGYLLCDDPGHLEEAENALERALALRPDLARTYIVLGKLRDRRGDVEGAVAAARKAVELQPTEADFHRALGCALWKANHLQEAIPEYRRAIFLDAGFADARNELGVVLRDAGDRTGALEVLREAVRLHPKHADLRNSLGELYYQSGDNDRAIEQIREAIIQRPGDASFHFNLGIALTSKGDHEGTIQAYRECVRLDPNHADAQSNLGVELMSRGDNEAAPSVPTCVRQSTTRSFV